VEEKDAEREEDEQLEEMTNGATEEIVGERTGEVEMTNTQLVFEDATHGRNVGGAIGLTANTGSFPFGAQAMLCTDFYLVHSKTL
jgi:hypothetical protein